MPLRSASAPGAAVASATRLGRDLRRLAGADARRLGGWALAVVAAVVTGPDSVGGWITSDRVRVEDAEFAFVEAEEQRG